MQGRDAKRLISKLQLVEVLEARMVEIVDFKAADPLLDWFEITDALAAGHQFAKAEIGDQLLWRRNDTLLSRAAWIDGIGSAVKTAFVVPSNSRRGLPTTTGAVTLFDDETGQLTALLDFKLVTKWKTAGDSMLAARRLARPNSSTILIVGAGTVARSLVEAYSALFPAAEFLIWNRTESRACQMAADYSDTVSIQAAVDLAESVHRSDIVACATISTAPIIKGTWLRPGTHLDLIGAYRPDMREVDDDALRASRIFVDSRESTLDHIGELKIPLGQGIISRDDVVADFYDLNSGAFERSASDCITLFKNGGGAHLDLMTANYILRKWQSR